MSFKPALSAEKGERQKALPLIPHEQHRQANLKEVDNDSIEMAPLQGNMDSQGRDRCWFALFCLQVILTCACK